MDAAEALRRAGRGAVLSHETAGSLHALDLVETSGPAGPLPAAGTVTVPRNRSRLVLPDWRVVRADIPVRDLDSVAGLAVTSVLRTLVDLARCLPLEAAVAAVDSALRRELVSLVAVEDRLTAPTGRGSAAPRAVAALLDPRSGSVLESLLRVLLVQAGLAPTTQYVIRDRLGLFVARVDFCWPAQRLVVEADGFAFHADRAAYRRDRDRLNQLERLGWRVLRFTWEDVRGRPDHVIALIRECLSAAAA